MQLLRELFFFFLVSVYKSVKDRVSEKASAEQWVCVCVCLKVKKNAYVFVDA